MRLPDAGLQLAYGHLAWALVIAAVVLWGWRSAAPRTVWAVIALTAALVALPGEASPVHWLGLAFQWPSALLAALCAASVWRRLRPDTPPTPLMPLPLAAVLAFAGSVLYLDASGWLALGVYGAGFSADGAPATGAMIAVLAAWAVWQGRHTTLAWVLLASTTAFAVLRLPTGNLWDALLDPFVWVWAIITVFIHAARGLRARQRVRSWAARPVTSKDSS